VIGVGVGVGIGVGVGGVGVPRFFQSEDNFFFQ